MNKEALGLDFVPKVLHHREAEYDTMVSFIASIVQNMAPSHFMVYGPKGTGKTTVIKYIFKNDVSWVVHKYGHKIYPVYISCKNKTSASLIRDILKILEPDAKIARTGVHMSYYMDKIEEHMKVNPGVYIFCMDDIEQLPEFGALEVLADLNGPGGKHYEFNIVGITSSFDFWSRLSEPLQSRLIGNKIIFTPYDIRTLTSIIKERAELALKPGALYAGAAALIAVKADGDARYAMKLLSAVALRGQQIGVSMLLEDDVNKAQAYFDRQELYDCISALTLHHKMALISVVDLQRRVLGLSMSTQVIHDNYRRVCDAIGLPPRVYMSLFRMLDDLTNYGIMVSDIVNTGRGSGRSRVYKLNISDSEIISILKDTSRIHSKDSELVYDVMREIKLIRYEPIEGSE
ncbi:MAG: AAA family ATPase [Candidatus Aenigmarchaeota archaeon]|nr:AAA family ATPase [Candidatus Aenigmarchaeota archaeon]